MSNKRGLGYSRLWNWFGLSYASFLTIPRVLMHEMPDEWQEKMCDLLEEYQAMYPNQPDVGTTVRFTEPYGGKLIKGPKWLLNYRHPDKALIAKMREMNK